MSGKEVSRIELVDGSGASLALVIAANGTGYKFYAVHTPPGEVSAKSLPWLFVNKERAEQFQRGKADDAIRDGWREIVTEPGNDEGR